MLSEQEKRFLKYWGDNRDKEKKLSRQLYIGLPIGICFAIAIVFSVIGGGWYERAFMVANAQVNPLIFVIALIAIIVFIAIFYKKFRWEQNEQLYRELLIKQKREQDHQAAE